MNKKRKRPTNSREIRDLGTFKRMPPAVLDRLLAKGVKEAEELDRAIRGQFEMTAADAMMRLR